MTNSEFITTFVVSGLDCPSEEKLIRNQPSNNTRN